MKEVGAERTRRHTDLEIVHKASDYDDVIIESRDINRGPAVVRLYGPLPTMSGFSDRSKWNTTII